MNAQETEGKSMQIRGEAKAKWARLTEDDVALLDGDIDKLAGRIVELYGTTREQVGVELDHLMKDLNRIGHATKENEKPAETPDVKPV